MPCKQKMAIPCENFYKLFIFAKNSRVNFFFWGPGGEAGPFVTGCQFLVEFFLHMRRKRQFRQFTFFRPPLVFFEVNREIGADFDAADPHIEAMFYGEARDTTS